MPPHYLKQIRITANALRQAPAFIKKNRLWQNFGQIKWIARLLTAAGILLGLQFISAFKFWNFTPFNPHAITNAGTNLALIGSNLYQQFINTYQEGFKYLILICMQALIGHFAGRTSQLINQIPYQPSFKGYLYDQWRIIKVGGVSWIREILYVAIVSAIAGIVHLSFLENLFAFAIRCYLLGFTVTDVYCAQRGMSIVQSYRYFFRYMPVLLFIGMVYYLLSFIPLIGAPGGVVVCTVAALLAMNRLTEQTLPAAPTTTNLLHEQ